MTNNALYSRVKDVSIGQPTLQYINTQQRKSPLCISATVRLNKQSEDKTTIYCTKKNKKQPSQSFPHVCKQLQIKDELLFIPSEALALHPTLSSRSVRL